MKHEYQVDCGQIVISDGAGRGSSLSDEIPLFNENIAQRFSDNETYLDMQRASKGLQKRAGTWLRLIIVIVVVTSITYVGTASETTANAGDVAGMAVVVALMSMLLLIPMLLAVGVFTKENIGGRRINILIDSPDVRSSLRAYYEDFAVKVIRDFSNSTTLPRPDIRDFKIRTTADVSSKVGSREIILSSRCYNEDKMYDIEVTTRFNPIYYNLKVVGYTIS